MGKGVLPVRQILASPAAFWRSKLVRKPSTASPYIYISILDMFCTSKLLLFPVPQPLRSVLTIDSLRSTSLTPVDVPFSVVRYS
jgi:hypothetical protein